ncbi:MAG: SDR family oxidoreductase [Lachnospiraceae bacterium]|nr:SDR family oxidoreductase [Lachnospiraceae bacterium]
MENYSELNKYILKKTIDGSIEKEYASKILKAISNEKIQEDYAIIGMECRAANNDTKEELWNSIISGGSGVRKMPQQRIDQVKSVLRLPEYSDSANMGYLNKIDEFDPSFFRISNREAKMMDPKQRMFLEVFYNALEDAGYSAEELSGKKVGVFVGADHSSDMQMSYKMMMRENDMMGEAGTVSGIVARRPAYIYNLKGPAIVVDTSCSSSLVAVHTACQSMRNGDCEMAVIGGINMVFYTSNEGKFSDIESQSVMIRSFDKHANGTNWGEGVAAVVLKPLKAAQRDHDNILAVLKGTGINNDGLSNGIVSPNPEAQEELICQTLKAAKVDPSTISYVECHGTGTIVGDQIEIRSLTNVYSKYTDKKQYCGIGTIKPNIGHLVGASALVSIVKLVMAIDKRIIPPSINFETPNPFIRFIESPFYVVDKETVWGEAGKPVRAAINSFGFSGTNTHAIFESAPIKENESNADEYELLTVSSMHKRLMPMFLERYIAFLSEREDLNFADFCYTANKGRRDCKNRMAFVVKNREDAISQLKEALDKLQRGTYIFTSKTEELQAGMREMRGYVAGYIEAERNNKAILNEIANLYEQGVDVKWEKFYEGCDRYRISIPVSLFKKTSYWIDPDEKLMDGYEGDTGFETKKNITDGIYRPTWRLSEKKKANRQNCRYLIFGDGDEFSKAVEEMLSDEGLEVCNIVRSRRKGEAFVVDPKDDNSYRGVLEKIGSADDKEYQVIYLWGIKDTDPVEAYNNLVSLLKALSFSLSGATIKIITDRAFTITGDDNYLGGNYQSMLLGLCRTVEREITDIRCECVDIVKEEIADVLGSKQLFIDKMCTNGDHVIVGIRKGLCFAGSHEKMIIQDDWETETHFRENGTYLLTGGCGALGSVITEYLVNEFNANVVLLVRHEFGDLNEWIKNHRESDKNYNSIGKIKNLIENGANISIMSTDITDADVLQEVVTEVEKKYGSINGVFHLAGVKGGKLIQAQQRNETNDVFDGKVRGLQALDKVFASKKIDFMILFSSLLNYFGVPGQSSYISANTYLDGYAEKADEVYRGRKTISINWDNFSDFGMAAELNIYGKQQKDLAYSFRNGLLFTDCMKAIRIAMGKGRSHLLVSFKDMDKLKDHLKQKGMLSDIEVTSKAKKVFFERQELSTEYVEPRDEVEGFFAQVWSELFEIDKVGVKDNFYDLGGDSIIAIKFVTAVKDKYQIGVGDVFKYLTIEGLARFVTSGQDDIKEKFEKAKHSLMSMANPVGLIPEEKEREERYLAGLEELEKTDFSKKKEFKNILLLGSTGFLGTYLVRDLMTKTSADVTLIVRGGTDSSAEMRQKEILDEFFGQEFYENYSDRLHILGGEVCEKNYGLSDEEYDRLCQDIDCIVNSVGKVDHYGKYEDFYEANVVSVENIIKMAKTGVAKEIHHISTKGVAMGDIKNREEVVFTEDDIDFGQEIPNYYTKSKNLAEKLLMKAREEGIFVNVYRTADIIGDSVTGRFQKNIDKNAVYLEVRAILNFACVMESDIGIWEVSFVDVVSSFLVALMISEAAKNQIYHLYSSERISINDWSKAFAKLGIEKQGVNLEDFLDYLYENIDNPEQKEYVNDFLLHTGILEWGETTRYKIMSDKTEAALSELGLKWERPTTEQLVNILVYGRKVGFFR